MSDVLVAIDLGSTRTKVLLVRPESVTQMVVENRPPGPDALVATLDALDDAIARTAALLAATDDEVVAMSLATSWPSLVAYCRDSERISFAFDDPRCVAAGSPTFGDGVLASSLEERVAFLASESKDVVAMQSFGGAVYEHLGGIGGIDEWTASFLGDPATLEANAFASIHPVGAPVGLTGAHLPTPLADVPLLCGSGDTLIAGGAAAVLLGTEFYLELGTSAVLLHTPHEGAPTLVGGWPRFGRELVDSVLNPGGADSRVLERLRDLPFDRTDAAWAHQLKHATPVVDGVARLDRGTIDCAPELDIEPASRRLTAAAAMLLGEVTRLVGDSPVACGGWLAEGPSFADVGVYAGLSQLFVLRSSTASALAILAANSLQRQDLLASVSRFAIVGNDVTL